MAKKWLKYGEEEAPCNESETFRQAYDRYHPILYTLALNMLHDRDIARDIVQDVFVKLWLNRFILENISGEKLLNYLYTITKNSVLNILKHKNIEQAFVSEKQKNGNVSEDSLLADLIKNENYRLVEKAIAGLSPIKQNVIRLKREGFSNIEIAQKLDLSVNTIKSHYSVALKEIKEKLKYIKE